MESKFKIQGNWVFIEGKLKETDWFRPVSSRIGGRVGHLPSPK